MAEACVVVGAGGIAGAWFPALLAEGVEIRAVVDRRVEAAAGRVAEFGLAAEATGDLGGALAAHRPEFVVDLTVPEAHREVTCTALAAGCHVLGEKPLAASLADARAMIAAADAAERLYMVSQSRRYHPTHDRLRRTLAAGAVGPLTMVTCDFFLGSHFGGFRDTMPSPLLLDMAIHHTDLVRFLTGLEPVAVHAVEFNPAGSWYAGAPAVVALFELTGGVWWSYRGSWCAEGCHTSWNGDWRFVGPRGTLRYERDGEPVGEVVAGDSGFHRPLAPAPLAPPAPLAEGQHGALREFLTALRGGPRPQGECHDNWASLAMVHAAVQSSREGRTVPVEAL